MVRDGEITEQEHQAMLDEMTKRMSSMSSGSAPESSQFDTFTTLLDSISRSEENSERSQTVQDMVDKLRTGNVDRQSFSSSMATLDNLYPRIDLKI